MNKSPNIQATYLLEKTIFYIFQQCRLQTALCSLAAHSWPRQSAVLWGQHKWLSWSLHVFGSAVQTETGKLIQPWMNFSCSPKLHLQPPICFIDQMHYCSHWSNVRSSTRMGRGQHCHWRLNMEPLKQISVLSWVYKSAWTENMAGKEKAGDKLGNVLT